MMDDIIRWGERDCKVEFDFYNDKILYRVIRTRNRISSTSNVELFNQYDSVLSWRQVKKSVNNNCF